MKNKVVYLQGGLGNQLFQYAFGLSLEKHTNRPVEFSTEFLSVFFPGKQMRHFELTFLGRVSRFRSAVPLLSLLKFYSAILLRKIGVERIFDLNWERPIINDDDFNLTHFIGYWQNPKYVLPIRDLLISNIKTEFKLTDEAKQVLTLIRTAHLSVSVHVRRGDYLSNKKSSTYYFPCGIEYYQRSIQELSSTEQEATVFIFSDDIDWCKSNFDFIPKKYFVLLKNSPPLNELILMSECNINVIANSTFSWWGAVLNKHLNRKVLCPARWYQDASIPNQLILEDWVRIPNP